MDGSMGWDYRFVTVVVKGQDDVSIVLRKPLAGYPEARINVHGLLFQCEDCRREAAEMRARDVRFAMEPEAQSWGVQADFEDLYGSTHVLLETSAAARA